MYHTLIEQHKRHDAIDGLPQVIYLHMNGTGLNVLTERYEEVKKALRQELYELGSMGRVDRVYEGLNDCQSP